jgi:M3 family oligoendopeptidase
MAVVSNRVAWRNGGGWTTVLAQADGGEPLEWRISIAEIERDGPFSDFSGYDRTIVAEGGSFTLEFDDGERVTVEPLVPFSFAGERAVLCRLHGAPVRAFNVMTLRDAFEHDVCVNDGEIEVSLIDVLADGPPIAEDFASFEMWERARRRFATWEALVKLRYAQDVRNERASEASAALARLAPVAQRRDAAMKRRLIESLDDPHLAIRWSNDLAGYDARIEPQLEREARLYDSYTGLTSSATFVLNGTSYNAASIAALARNAERSVRKAATAAIWRFYEERASALDSVFDGLVKCRAEMASELGHASYTALGHLRLARTDYSRDDVVRLREAIEHGVVPLCARIVERQACDLGLEAIMPWDEFAFDAGERLPSIDPASVLEGLSRAFSAAHPQLGAFAQMMIARGSFDLDPRPGKRAGAFCSFFPSLGMPHVFANVTGTPLDAASLVHEMGHAFQDYASRDAAAIEYIVPPPETGEVSSLALEFLLWPYYGEFFGCAAQRYRDRHIKTLVLMLPYIAAIDHFQELVYGKPFASPQERHGMWLELSARYLPYRRTGDIPHLARGAAWHRQHHVFGFPFYYIDYALALIAAFDLWATSQDDYRTAMERYLGVAASGGRLPFRTLLRTHGIRDPFDDAAQVLGTVENALERALLSG